jgi:hypothetical protein
MSCGARPNKGLELTAYSLRFAPASGSSSGLALAGKDLPWFHDLNVEDEHLPRRIQSNHPTATVW